MSWLDRFRDGVNATGTTFRQIRTGTKAAMEGGSKVYQAGSKKMGDVAGQAYDNWYKYLSTKEGKGSIKDIVGIKPMLKTAAFSGAMYGLSAVMTDDTSADHGDRMAHYAKHGVAATADVGADIGLGLAASVISKAGPWGAVVGGGIMAYNLLGGFFGLDAGSGVMNMMNYADEEYEKQRQGPKFNMTQNTSMALQRQLQGLHANGSNLGEMMHN